LVLYEGDTIKAEDLNLPCGSESLPPATKTDEPLTPTDTSTRPAAPAKFDPTQASLESYLEEIEKQEILNALETNRWNKTATAHHLGMSFRSLRYRLKKLKLE
jgi:two-component system response regulator PilR (NtrC family)